MRSHPEVPMQSSPQIRRVGTVGTALVLAAAALAFGACHVSTAPECSLDGHWAWEWNRNPSGSSLVLDLAASASTVTGTGVGYGVGPYATPDSIIVSGQVQPLTRRFALTLSYRSGRMVSYSGYLNCPGTLQGTATSGSEQYSLVFYRDINPLPGPSN
jgi:hypothetical protein